MPGSVRADSPLYSHRARRQGRTRSAFVSLAILAGVFALVAVLLGLAFAGSSQELAEGTRVAGVDVGGLTETQAVAELSRRYAEVEATPVTFVADDERFTYAANQLGVQPDWSAAVAAAARQNDGFGPIRGFRRIHTRFFGAEILPPLGASDAALDFALGKVEDVTNRAARNAALVRRGLRFEVVPDRSGRVLRHEAATQLIVRKLGSLERSGEAVVLPVAVAPPDVTARMLAPAARRAKIAVSAPVFLQGVNRRFRVPPRRIAELLELPRNGASQLAIGGLRADAYFRALDERVGNSPEDATWLVDGDTVQIVPSRIGTKLAVRRTSKALLRAATSRSNRVAKISIVRAAPERTTKEALAMGIDTRMASYKTYNAGTWDRITNLRLGVMRLDGTLVAPGGAFSLNDAIGERTTERGFRSAPVIIGTKYEEEVGGGTSQVATTVFNAAWEAGLRITERNPHSLYIDRYELGRDATVYWPSLDLKFVNDTDNWVLVRGFPESDGITVSIYGGERRRVESSDGTFTTTGSPPVRRIRDATLPIGKTVVEEEGSSPSRTSVTRTIYAPNGTLVREETWNTSYEGETRVVRVGTKQREPEPKPEPKTEREPRAPKPGPLEETVPPGETVPPAGTTPKQP
jgi:vancomycin resistance protein YoaR